MNSWTALKVKPKQRYIQGFENKSCFLSQVLQEADLKKRVDLKDKGVKRSDSLTKDEKTENNVKARERDLKNPGQRLRRFVQRESGLKRRHTVGGTRDFDKASLLF